MVCCASIFVKKEGLFQCFIILGEGGQMVLQGGEGNKMAFFVLHNLWVSPIYIKDEQKMIY